MSLKLGKNQISQYIQNIYDAARQQPQNDYFPFKANQVYPIIAKIDDLEIANHFKITPIMLEIIAYLFASKQLDMKSLTTMGALFSSLMSALLDRFLEHSRVMNITNQKHQSIPQPLLSAAKRKKWLAPLLAALGKVALDGICDGKMLFDSDMIDKLLSDAYKHLNTENFYPFQQILNSGLLRWRKQQGFQSGGQQSMYFIHHSLQEYLAAIYFVRILKHDKKQAQTLFQKHRHDPYFFYIWPFVASILNREKDLTLLEHFFKMLLLGDPIKPNREHNFYLAIRCWTETCRNLISPRLEAEINQYVLSVLITQASSSLLDGRKYIERDDDRFNLENVTLLKTLLARPDLSVENRAAIIAEKNRRDNISKQREAKASQPAMRAFMLHSTYTELEMIMQSQLALFERLKLFRRDYDLIRGLNTITGLAKINEDYQDFSKALFFRSLRTESNPELSEEYILCLIKYIGNEKVTRAIRYCLAGYLISREDISSLHINALVMLVTDDKLETGLRNVILRCLLHYQFSNLSGSQISTLRNLMLHDKINVYPIINAMIKLPDIESEHFKATIQFLIGRHMPSTLRIEIVRALANRPDLSGELAQLAHEILRTEDRENSPGQYLFISSNTENNLLHLLNGAFKPSCSKKFYAEIPIQDINLSTLFKVYTQSKLAENPLDMDEGFCEYLLYRKISHPASNIAWFFDDSGKISYYENCKKETVPDCFQQYIIAHVSNCDVSFPKFNPPNHWGSFSLYNTPLTLFNGVASESSDTSDTKNSENNDESCYHHVPIK